MSAAVKLHALGATPQESAMVLVFELCAAAGGARKLDEAAKWRACCIAHTVLAAAESRGFEYTDALLDLAARGRRRVVVLDLAAQVVARVGGPEKLFALVDLVTTPADWIGTTTPTTPKRN